MLRPSVMHWQLIIKRCLRNWKCHCRYCHHNQIAVIFSINYHLHNSYKGLSEVLHNRCSSLFQEIVTNSFSLSKLDFCWELFLIVSKFCFTTICLPAHHLCCGGRRDGPPFTSIHHHRPVPHDFGDIVHNFIIIMKYTSVPSLSFSSFLIFSCCQPDPW